MADLPNDASAQQAEQWIAEQEKAAKYGTPQQMLNTAGEGFTEGVTGPFAPLAERIAGVPSEGIRARQETNPWTHGLAKGAGFVAGLAAGTGIPGLIEQGASEVAGKLGVPVAAEALAQAPVLTQIGSAAAKTAIEGLMFGAGDEVSKMVVEDPHQTLSTAAVNIGLSGLIGGGAGAGFASVPPLWKAASESKLGQVLSAIAGKGGGIDGGVSEDVLLAIDRLGVNAPADVRVALSKDPMLAQMAKSLEQSDTSRTGLAYQKSLNEFKTAVNERVKSSLEPFGNKLTELSKAEAGKRIGTELANEYQARVSPLSKEFEQIKENFGHVPVQSQIPKIADDVANLAMEQGWMVSPSSDEAMQVQKVLRELPGVTNLKQLSDYITSVGNATSKDRENKLLMRVGGMLKDVIRQGETAVIEREFGHIAPELIDNFRAAQKAYAAESRLKDALNDRLHVGGSTRSYADSIREMAKTDSETLLGRLANNRDADLLRLLQENYPKTAAELQKHHVDVILDKASSMAKPGESFNAASVVKQVAAMEPELRDFAIPKLAQDHIEAAATIADKFAQPVHNFSNSGRAIDAALQHVPGAAVAMASMAMGSNPVMALTFGALTKALGKDAPDALRLSLLKFLATKGEVSPSGFKGMFEFMRHVVKGESAVRTAVGAVLHEGADVIPMRLKPRPESREALEKALEVAEADPTHLIDKGGLLAQYMPEQGGALGMLGASAATYLLSLKPRPSESGPFSEPAPVNQVAQAKYNRALDIAQQPLIVLQSIKNGSITSDDVQTLVKVFPSLYQRFESKLTEQLINHLASGKQVPYAVRLGLSVFAQKPLDSSMTGPSIMAAQPMPGAPQQGQKSGGGSPQKLNKVDQLAMTPGQASQARQSGQQS